MTMLLGINRQRPSCEAEAVERFGVHDRKQTAMGYERGEKKTACRRQTRGSNGVAGVEELSLHCRGSRHRAMANFLISSLWNCIHRCRYFSAMLIVRAMSIER